MAQNISSFIPEAIQDSLTSLLAGPNQLISDTLQTTGLTVFLLIVASLVIITGIVFRIFFGKNCQANKSVSAAIGLGFLYALTITVYCINPYDLSKFLSPLPFVLFREDILIIVPFAGGDTPFVCTEILSLIILCFIVHTVSKFIPSGKSFFSWIISRIIVVCASIFLNLAAIMVMRTFFQSGIASFAPAILLAILGIAIIIALFNPLLCIIFTIVNPVVGILYTFFFNNLIGKQLTKAVISALLICTMFFIMESNGWSVISLNADNTFIFSICGIVLIPLWYLFDKKL